MGEPHQISERHLPRPRAQRQRQTRAQPPYRRGRPGATPPETDIDVCSQRCMARADRTRKIEHNLQQVREEQSEEQKDTSRIPLHAVQPHRQCRRQCREEPPRERGRNTMWKRLHSANQRHNERMTTGGARVSPPSTTEKSGAGARTCGDKSHEPTCRDGRGQTPDPSSRTGVRPGRNATDGRTRIALEGSV